MDLKPVGRFKKTRKEAAKQVRSARPRRLNDFGGDHVTENSAARAINTEQPPPALILLLILRAKWKS